VGGDNFVLGAGRTAGGGVRLRAAVVVGLPVVLVVLPEEILFVQIFVIDGAAELLHESDLLFSQFKDVLRDVVFEREESLRIVLWPLGPRH
jgi:hypothetical protein